jgi:hypothetical protein
MTTSNRKLILGSFLLIVLGWVLSEGYARVILRMKAKAAVRTAYSLHQAWFAYATNHDDAFPTAQHDSNEAMRELFRGGLVDDEKLFWIQGCAWCSPNSRPDGKIGDEANGFAEAVSAGENHWACTAGLTTKHDRLIPLIMDGFTEQVGQWCDDPKKKGGVWNGRYAIIVRIGGSARVYDLPPAMDLSIHDGPVQTLQQQVDHVPGARLLNPL